MIKWACLIALAGCSSLDEDVFANITSASVTVDTAHPAALAAIRVEMDVQAGWRAHHTVYVYESWLEPPGGPGQTARVDLDLAFPPGFDPSFDSSEHRTVWLENAATTNAMLTPLCGTMQSLFAELGYTDENTFTSGTGVQLTVACP